MNAIILRITRLKDSDAIVDWLTDTDVIMTTYAARVQTSKAYPNGLEPLCVYEIEYTRRPHQDMGRLTSALCVERFEALTSDMQAYACACAALEAIGNLCPNDTLVFELFSSLLATLAVMNTAPDLALMALTWLECFLMHQLGALPNLEMCAQCAQILEQSTWFQQELGFLCATCAHTQTNIPAFVLPGIRRLRYQSLRTTVQNALNKGDEQSRLRILMPMLKLFMAIMCDNSSLTRLKAHRFVLETYEMPASKGAMP